jgi:hypothetical protein
MAPLSMIFFLLIKKKLIPLYNELYTLFLMNYHLSKKVNK